MLQGSDIQEIPNTLLKNKPKITYISFKNSKINVIGPQLFRPLTELKYANFEKNVCIDQKAETPLEIENLKSKFAGCAVVEAETVA